MKRLLSVIVCLAALGIPAAAEGLRTVPFFRFGIASDSIGTTGMIVADVTGDTRPEIISCSAGAPVVFGYSAGSYVPLWHGPEVNCTAVAVGDADGDGATDIIVADAINAGGYSSDVSILIFDPRGLGNARTRLSLPGNQQVNDIAIGNVDFDALPEIVAITAYATTVYDATTLEQQWSAEGYGGQQVALGDIEGDARPEIIINSNGYYASQFAAVLDGGNEVVSWGYAGGFGARLLVGNLDGDAKQEIVVREDTDITILNGDFTSWSFASAAWPVGIGDANGDGVNEVLVDADYGGVRGLRATDGALLWTVAPPETGVFGEVVVGDVDGDASPEIVYGAGTSSYRDILIVASAVSQTVEHQSLDLDGELHSATGDVDGDGRADLVVASMGTNNGYDGGIAQILDPRTRAIKGQLSRTNATNFRFKRIAIGQLDDDPAREIVALGNDIYTPTIIVWDAATKLVEWKNAATFNAPQFVTTDMAVVNVDGDARDEIVVGMTNGNLVVLNGASPVVQASTTLNGALVAIELADVDDDGVLEVAAGTTTKLYLIDTANWSVTKETALSEIEDVAASAVQGGRIAVSFNQSTMKLRLYDLQLTALWTCALSEMYGGYFEPFPVAFADAGGEPRILAGTGFGEVKVFPVASGPDCPAATTIEYSQRPIFDIQSADVTGDGWPEMILDNWNAVEAHLIGLVGELRGDADGDGSIGPQDIDELTDNLFGATPGILPMADVNADHRISGEDVFALIHYEYGGGPEPQP